jgi:hypothetical protein
VSAKVPGTVPLAERHAPPLGGFNLTFLSIEVRRLVRNRRTVVTTLVVPVVLFLLFKANRRSGALEGIGFTAATTMTESPCTGQCSQRPRAAQWCRSNAPRGGAASSA